MNEWITINQIDELTVMSIYHNLFSLLINKFVIYLWRNTSLYNTTLQYTTLH